MRKTGDKHEVLSLAEDATSVYGTIPFRSTVLSGSDG